MPVGILTTGEAVRQDRLSYLAEQYKLIYFLKNYRFCSNTDAALPVGFLTTGEAVRQDRLSYLAR